MKLEIQSREDHQVRLITELEADQLERFKHQAARKISQEAKVPGFRPGKAPYDVVRRLYGDKALTDQAVELLIDDIYPKILKEAAINPSGPGNLDEIINLDPPTFAFIVPLMPTIKLGDYKSIRKEYQPLVVDDKKVDEYIERVRSSYATVEPVERPAKEGDLVYLILNGTIANPSEGQVPQINKDTTYQQIIDKEGDFKEKYPYPGFSLEMAGLSAGDEKDVAHDYGEDDSISEPLRGKHVDYHLKVETVKVVKLPDMNDEFVKGLGEFESVDKFKEVVHSNLEQEGLKEYDQDYFTQLVDTLREQSAIKYPPQMIEKEVEDLLENFTQDLSHQNMDLEAYLKLTKTDKDSFMEKTIRPTAIRQLERSLVISEVGQAEQIKLNPKEIEAVVAQTLSNMQQSGQLKNKKQVSSDLANAITYDTANRIMNRTVLNLLKSYATGALENQVPSVESVEKKETESLPENETPTDEAAQEPIVQELAVDGKENLES